MTLHILVLTQVLLAPDFLGGNRLTDPVVIGEPMPIDACETAARIWRATSFRSYLPGQISDVVVPEDAVTVERQATCLPVQAPQQNDASDGVPFIKR